jgi:hypothetical protein
MSEDARRRREQTAREEAARNKRVFDRASFTPYGLDERWRGLRWFGGHSESDRGVDRLVLAPGDKLGDPTSPQFRVETYRIESAASIPVHRWDAAHSLVQHFWSETGVLPDDVRSAVFPTEDRGDLDPFGPWESIDLLLDGTAVVFRVLAHDDFWVGVGDLEDAVVAVQSRRWPLNQTGLVMIDDFTPYVEGSVEVVMRWRPA